jgi:hypothetical protein
MPGSQTCIKMAALLFGGVRLCKCSPEHHHRLCNSPAFEREPSPHRQGEHQTSIVGRRCRTRTFLKVERGRHHHSLRENRQTEVELFRARHTRGLLSGAEHAVCDSLKTTLLILGYSFVRPLRPLFRNSCSLHYIINTRYKNRRRDLT